MALAGSFYDNLLGDRGTLTYDLNYPVDGVVYPEKDQVNIFGPIYVPRVYGKDLETLEIASSGSISFSVQDIHSLDIDRNNTTSNVSIATLCNDSFSLTANAGAMSLAMAAGTNSISLASANVIGMTASNGLTFSTSGTSVSLTESTMDVAISAGCNISLTAVNDISAASTAATTLTAGTDMSLSAVANAFITGASTVVNGTNLNKVVLGGTDSNAYLALDGATYDATLFAKSNVNLNALASVNVAAGSAITWATQSDFVIAASNDIKLLANHDAIMQGANDVNIAASNNAIIQAAGAMASFANYAATITATSNLTMTSTKDVTITSAATTTVTSSNDVTMTSLQNVTVTSGQKTIVTSSNDVDITSASNVTITSGQATTVTSSNNVTITSASNVTVTSANSTTITSASNVTVTSSNNVTLTSGDTTTVTSASNVIVTAQTGQVRIENGTITAAFDPNGTYTVVSGGSASNSYMTFKNNNDIATFTQSNYSITSSNNLALTAKNDFNLSATNLTLTGSTAAQMTAGSSFISMNGDGTFTADTASYTFTVAGAASPMMSVLSDKVVINGNLQIQGTLDTINTTETNLWIQDKTIQLATSSNAMVIDGLATNSEAGVRIAGFPATACNTDPYFISASNNPTDVNGYTKALLWNYGVDGISALGTSNIEKEPFWELRGGSFRITHTKLVTDGNGVVTGSNEVSFGFRVNHLDELELVKKYFSPSESNYIFKRVAKFGKTLNL